MKKILTRFTRGGLIGVASFSCLLAVTTFAQNTVPAAQVVPGTAASISPQQGIGAAPANTPQHDMLNGALSTDTRETLAEAMNADPSVADAPLGILVIGPGEAAQLDGAHSGKIAFDTAPDSLKKALGGDIQSSLSTSW